MQSFDLNIVAGQIVLATVFGAPIIALIAGTAFVIAALPATSRVRLTLPVAGAVVAAGAIILAICSGPSWSVLPPVFLAVLIGLGVRSSEGFQRLRLPFGILLALIITSALFAFGHYGLDNCYP